MFITCNNYPDKVKEYLVEYNAFVIIIKYNIYLLNFKLTIKKLPNQFPDNEKIKKYSYLLLKI